MASLLIISNFTVTSDGVVYSGKQGETTDATTDEFTVTVDGLVHQVNTSIATAAVATVWDEDNDTPADFDYLFVWSSVVMYLQLIGQTSNIITKLLAKVPYMLCNDQMLAAASTTAITGGTEPTLEDIDSVVIGNYSGGAGKVNFAVVD